MKSILQVGFSKLALQFLPGGVGVGVGGVGVGGVGGAAVVVGVGPLVITMSAQEFHTWSVSSQSHLQLRMYSPSAPGTCTSSSTFQGFAPPTKKPQEAPSFSQPGSNMVPAEQKGVADPWFLYAVNEG